MVFINVQKDMIWRKTRLHRYEITHSVSVRRGSRHGALRHAISRRGARFFVRRDFF